MIFPADMKGLVRELIHAKDAFAETSRNSCHIKGMNDSSTDTALVYATESCDDVRYLSSLMVGGKLLELKDILAVISCLTTIASPTAKISF